MPELTLVLPLSKAGPTQGGSEPYGSSVRYADPGYKEDGKKRYPLNKKRLPAAWRYINMPKNHEGYTSDEVERIKSKIRSAYKEAFGYEPGESDKEDLKKAVDDSEDYDPDADYDSDSMGEEADSYSEENDPNDHLAMIEEQLDDALTMLAALLTKESTEPLEKAWSESAREAAAAARGHVGRIRAMSAQHTGLPHRAMNKSGFIKVREIQNPIEQARGRDYNNARASLLKARTAMVNVATGKAKGNLKELASDFHKAQARVKAAGAYYRISKS